MRCIVFSVALIVYTEAGSHNWKSSEEFGSSEEYSSSLRPITPHRIIHNEQQGPGQPPFSMAQPHDCGSKVKYPNPLWPQEKERLTLQDTPDFANEDRSTSSESSISNQPKDVAKDYGLSDTFIKPIHLPTIVNISDIPKEHVLNGTVHSSEERLSSSKSSSSKYFENETLAHSNEEIYYSKLSPSKNLQAGAEDNRRLRPVPIRRRPELIPLDHKGPVAYAGYSSEEDSAYSKPIVSKKAQVGIKDESVRIPNTDTHNSNIPFNKKHQPSKYLYSEEDYEHNSQRYVPKHKSKKHKHRNSDYGQSGTQVKPIHLPTIVKITDVPNKHDLDGDSIDDRLTSSNSIPSKKPSANTKAHSREEDSEYNKPYTTKEAQAGSPVSDDGINYGTLISNSPHRKKHKHSKYLYSDNYDETYPRYRPTKQRSEQQFNIDYSQPSLNKRFDY